MTAYRFCRPDDLPLLVRAVEICFDPHFPGAPATTAESFRREMKELDVWPSNSMVALAGDEPVAVSIGTKRAREVLVSRVGVRPGHQGQGHGRHLVTSLSQKLAVLGPPRLVAEVPGALPAAEAFFAACGYRRETAFTDWRRPAGPLAERVRAESAETDTAGHGAPPVELAAPVTATELDAAGVLPAGDDPAWERRRDTLVQRDDRLRGLALAGAEGIAAWALWLPPGEAGVELSAVGLGCPGPQPATDREAAGLRASRPPVHPAEDDTRRHLLLGLLLRHLISTANAAGAPIVLPRLAPGDVPEPLLVELGFTPAAQYARWAAVATPL